jgi:glycine/D-amino acid oxidase-like deaminating enzyme
MSKDTLAVVGGGFTGLWTALLAKQRDPNRPVTLFEAGRVGQGASGASAGLVDPCPTYSWTHGQRLWPDEIDQIGRLAASNLAGLIQDLARHDIDCRMRLPGRLLLATQPHQVPWLLQAAAVWHGHPSARLLDRHDTRSATGTGHYVAALHERPGVGSLDPVALVAGLRAACLSAGVRVIEHRPVVGLDGNGSGVELVARFDPGMVGRLPFDQVALATGAARSLLPAVRKRVLPAFAYWIESRPLTRSQVARLGWFNGCDTFSECGYRFHYGRIVRGAGGSVRLLWGGRDAVVHLASERRVARHPAWSQRQRTFNRLLADFRVAFPALADLRFQRGHGAAVDLCAWHHPFYGTRFDGRVAFAAGFSGVGIVPSRFAAQVMLDLLAEPGHGLTELTALRMVRELPRAMPPEPARWLAAQVTRAAAGHADASGGHRGPWLRLLDRAGFGY